MEYYNGSSFYDPFWDLGMICGIIFAIIVKMQLFKIVGATIYLIIREILKGNSKRYN